MSYSTIKQYLTNHADSIQKEATRQHKKNLKEKNLRVEFFVKYQKHHIQTIEEIAKYLNEKHLTKGVAFFTSYGEKLGKESVQDGLTIEEVIDGTIYLKQAIWQKLKQAGLLEDISLEDFYTTSQIIGTYIDTLASKIAFTFHKQRQRIESNLNFLADASKILSSSLDYQTTLNTIANLAVPEIADWCTVDLLDTKGDLHHVAVAHKDPKRIAWARELQKKQRINHDATSGVPNVLRTGESELYPHITDDMLVTIAKNHEELKLLRSIGFTSVMIVPLVSKKKPIGAITFVNAETKRNYNQADLRMAEELATRASVAIENAQLYKGSQDAITVRDEFISVASHELKTPVTSVKMFTQVLKKHSQQIGDKKAVSHLTKMDKQLNKLTELIYDLLNVSKIQAGKMEFENKMFDFDKTIQEVIVVLQQTTEKHMLIIEGETGAKVYGDAERIGQVVNNLVSNAIKYSPKAENVIIKLSKNKKNVQVDVQDFGIGMAKEHFKKIFERFYRVYDSNDKTFPGLGIGLYISGEIIKRHCGKLWVKSTPGKGSTFSFSIPIDCRQTT